jgi:hypothetical protein
VAGTLAQMSRVATFAQGGCLARTNTRPRHRQQLTPARKHKDATLMDELIDENEDETDEEHTDDGEDEDEEPTDLEQREQIAKHNPYPDKLGRFTTAEGAACRRFHEMLPLSERMFPEMTR